jgi:hypothetical protein
MLNVRLPLNPCYFCDAECDEDDFCYGCGNYICSECDQIEQIRHHLPDDHRAEDAEDEEE